MGEDKYALDNAYLAKKFNFSETDSQKLPDCSILAKEDDDKVNLAFSQVCHNETMFSVNLHSFLSNALNISNSIEKVILIDLMWFRAGIGQKGIFKYLIKSKIQIKEPYIYNKRIQLSSYGFFVFGLLTGLLPPNTTDNFHTPKNLRSMNNLIYKRSDINFNLPALILEGESFTALELVDLLGKKSPDDKILSILKIVRNLLIVFGANPPKKNFIPLFDKPETITDLKPLPIPARSFQPRGCGNGGILGFTPLTAITGDVVSALQFRMFLWRRKELRERQRLNREKDYEMPDYDHREGETDNEPRAVADYEDHENGKCIFMRPIEEVEEKFKGDLSHYPNLLLFQLWQLYLSILINMPSSLMYIITEYSSSIDIIMLVKVELSRKIIPVDGYGYFDTEISSAFQALHSSKSELISLRENLIEYMEISTKLNQSAAFNAYNYLCHTSDYIYEVDTLRSDQFRQDQSYRKGLALKMWFICICKALIKYQKTPEQEQLNQLKRIVDETPKYMDDDKIEVSVMDDDKNLASSDANYYTKELKELIPKIQKNILIFANSFKSEPDSGKNFPAFST